MRTHTTTTLKDLIKVQMNPENQMTAQEIDTWIGALPQIQEELIKHIRFFAHSIFTIPMVKQQLRQIQAECTSLLNLIDKYDSCSGDSLILRTNTVACLEAVLLTLTDNYRQYADLSANINRMHYREIVNNLSTQLPELKERLIYHKISNGLQTVVLNCIKKLIVVKTASYHEVDYVLNILPLLKQILGDACNYTVENKVADCLYRHHHNSNLFISYVISHHETELNKLADLNDRQTYLTRIKFSFRKHSVSPKSPKYTWDGPNIFDHLMKFFDTELACLTIAIEKAKPKIVPIKAPVAVPLRSVDYKLRFTFSVESLAYLIKLMVNANIIEPGIKAELLRHVAANFQTPGTKVGGISEGSFTTKYKNVTQSTSVTVKAGLMAMLKLIDKEF
jgi:hypothetical protein